MRVAQALSARRACAAAGAGAGRGPEHAGHGQQPDSHGAGDQKAATVDQLLSRHAQLAHFQGNLDSTSRLREFQFAQSNAITHDTVSFDVRSEECMVQRFATLNPKP